MEKLIFDGTSTQYEYYCMSDDVSSTLFSLIGNFPQIHLFFYVNIMSFSPLCILVCILIVWADYRTS